MERPPGGPARQGPRLFYPEPKAGNYRADLPRHRAFQRPRRPAGTAGSYYRGYPAPSRFAAARTAPGAFP